MCPFSTKTFYLFCNHIARLHKNDPRFIVYCQVGNCGFSSKSWIGYKSHISRKHKNENLRITCTNETEYIDEETNDDIDFPGANIVQDNSTKHINAGYLLSLETRHNLSQIAVNCVAETTSELIQQQISLYKLELKKQIQLQGYQNIDTIIDSTCIESSFCHLTTEHKRLKYYSDNFQMIDLVPVLLGFQLKTIKGEGKRVRDFGYVIPFKELLTALYNLPEFLFWIEHSHEQRNGVMMDFCDGNFMQNHALFSHNKKALQIVLYNDDLEIVNPLGTHVKKHKITVFYVTFGNIPPEYRSKLQAIFPIAFVKTKLTKKHGLNKLLQDFIQTVNIMSSGGFTINVNGTDHNVEGALVIAPADTPASNLIGGFKEGVGFSYKKCRTCKITAREMKTKFSDDKFSYRTMTEYRECCNILESEMSKDAKKYWSTIFGINTRSCLFELTNFDIIEGLVHDPMHILLEGALKYELALFLGHCINRKYFRLHWFNSQMQSFPFSYLEESSKPEPIDRKQCLVEINIKQTAAAMLTLVGVLPFILGPKIPKTDKKWQTLLRLIQITFMVTSPCITVETPEDLRRLIESHHKDFQMEYPKASIKPKLHFMCHFPLQMHKFGPGRILWCMRFEAKHAFFKNKKWKCFKNLPLSMAKFHQKWLCGQMRNALGQVSDSFLYSGDEIKEGDDVIINQMTASKKNCIQTKFPQLESIFVTKRVDIHGSSFREGSIITLSYDDSHLPSFGYVTSVLVDKQVKYFLYLDLIIRGFDEHLLAYEVDFGIDLKIVNYHELFLKMPLCLHKCQGKMYILNKFAYLSEL